MISFASLLVRETKAAILGKFLQVAQAVGLPVTSWQPGDPTDAQFQAHATVLDDLEAVIHKWIAASFLDTCAADTALYGWLVWTAYQGFGYTARTASRATSTITLTNTGGGLFDADPGDLTFINTATRATYRNTSGGHLASGPGTTLTLDIEADEPGSASSAGIGDIDAMITTWNDVTCANAQAAIGLDAEPAQSIVTGCRAKLSAMSPNGPRDAYNYVACNAAITGTSAVTMARTSDDSTTGNVSVLLAGPNMPIGAPDVALVQAAFASTCAPLCITPTAASAAALVVNVVYTAVGYQSWGVTAAEAATAIDAAVRAWFAAIPIAGDVVPPATTGEIRVNMIEAAIASARRDKIVRVTVTTPAGTVPLTATQKPVCGTVTASAPFAFIPDP